MSAEDKQEPTRRWVFKVYVDTPLEAEAVAMRGHVRKKLREVMNAGELPKSTVGIKVTRHREVNRFNQA